jgi:hypothetical protein
VFVGHFPDRGVVPASRPDLLVSPYRWPDLRAREVRLLWPVTLSFVAPCFWLMNCLRLRAGVRGFPIGK